MCLALPMRVIAVDGQLATIAVEGLEQQCSLALLPDAGIGDYVLVHAGYAISRLDEDEANETYDLLAEIGLLQIDENGHGSLDEDGADGSVETGPDGEDDGGGD